MARSRRRTDHWDDFAEAFRGLFTLIHPLWSIPLAAVFFTVPVLWFRYKVPIPEVQMLGYLFGGGPALMILGAGFKGWLLRAERQRFFSARVDLDRIKGLTWQEFERRVADVYRHRGFNVEETGGGGADGVKRNRRRSPVRASSRSFHGQMSSTAHRRDVNDWNRDRQGVFGRRVPTAPVNGFTFGFVLQLLLKEASGVDRKCGATYVPIDGLT